MILHVDASGDVIGSLVTPSYSKVTNVALTPDGTGLYAVASNATETEGALFYIDLKERH
jgi:hypothetical protein